MSTTDRRRPVLAEHRRPSRQGRLLRLLAVLGCVVVVVIAGLTSLRTVTNDLGPPTCTATSGGSSVSFSAEQAGNAAVIAGLAVRRGLPERAATIAVATAMQESKLRNLRFGDRDSVGLFQQRPSQGWGPEAKLLDPAYATGKFYDALVKVPDYTERPLTEVAQQVQRSAYPDAYAQHEDEATVLARVLTGSEPAALVCRIGPARQPGDPQRMAGDLSDHLGVTPTVAAGGSVTAQAGDAQQAWAVALWAVARAEIHGIASVQIGDRRWSRDDPAEWRSVAPATPEHRIVVVLTPGAGS